MSIETFYHIFFIDLKEKEIFSIDAATFFYVTCFKNATGIVM